MTGATHFIEVFKSKNKCMQGLLSDIKVIEKNLKTTAISPTLKTIAVWKIKFKPGHEPKTDS